MEIRLNYIAKDGCVNDITIKGARGAKVTKADLHEAAQAIRGGKFRLFEEDDGGSIWLIGQTAPFKEGGIMFATNEDGLNVVWGEGDKPLKVSGLVTVSK